MAEVDDKAPWQRHGFIADFSAYTGPITDRNKGAFLPALAVEGPASKVGAAQER